MSGIKSLAATAILLCGAAPCALVVLGQTAPLAARSTDLGGARTVTPAAERCAALAGQQLDQVTIVSANMQLAGAPVSCSKMPAFLPKMPVGADVSGLPTFCRIVGSIRPEPGSDIRFEVWMPGEGWDGRLNGGNSGGFAGYVNYMDLAAAVRSGQAGVASDTGHNAAPTSADWAKDRPERVRDYGWRAVHLSTVAAKKLLAAYYGKGPTRSYFIGCSNGGRQALMEASRFPADYDGIVAGAPAAVWTDVPMAMISTVQAQRAIGAKLRPEQARLLQSEVISQCDALDGQADGLVSDPRKCKVDFSRLACTSTSSGQCFAPPQLTALHRIYEGVRNASGRRLAYGFPPSGSEAGVPLPELGWDGWIFGGGDQSPAHKTYSAELLGKMVPKPVTTTETFDFKSDPARLRAALAQDLDAQPNMRRFSIAAAS